MEPKSSPAQAQGVAAPQPSNANAVVYVLQQETAPSSTPQHDFAELWGPPILAFVAALLGIAVPLAVKWFADNRERRLTAKRDLYLKVADSVNEAAEAMGMLVSVDIPINDAMKKFASAMGALGKAEVVASIPLVHALARLQKTTATFIGKLIAMRAEIEKAQGRIQINDKYINKIQEQIENNLAEQKRININGGPYDDGRFDRLQRDFNALQEQQNEFFKKNDSDYSVRQKAIEAMAFEVVGMRKHVTPLHADVLELIRQELDFMPGFNKAEYLAIKTESGDDAEQFVKDVQQDLKKAFERDSI